jgi:uncharacterized membrane protein
MIIDKILKAPLIILVLASFVGGIYAAYFKIQNISWVVPVIIGVILVLYFIGEFLNKRKNDNSKPNNP